MKKISYLLLVAGMLGSVAVNAQSKFEGAYGQLGIGYQQNNLSLSNGLLVPPAGNSPSSYNMSTNVSSNSGFNGAISAGYNFGVNPQFLLGVGVDYQPFASQSSNLTASNSSLSPSSQTMSYKQNNQVNVFLTPGLVLDADKLLYAKVGYSATQLKYTTSAGASSNTNYNGYILGLGYKQIISGGFYGFGEVNYASYGNQTLTVNGSWGGTPSGTYTETATSSLNNLSLLVGVGYKF